MCDDSETFRQVRDKIAKAAYHFPKRARLTPEYVDFVESLLIVDPVKRMTVEEALKHSWIVKKSKIISSKTQN